MKRCDTPQFVDHQIEAHVLLIAAQIIDRQVDLRGFMGGLMPMKSTKAKRVPRPFDFGDSRIDSDRG